jgi:Flp pilus assembly pilin Flp
MPDVLVTTPRAQDEQGQGTLEYVLVLALLAVACVGAMTLLGTQISDTLTAIANVL